jgi:anti-anti-sigma factor
MEELETNGSSLAIDLTSDATGAPTIKLSGELDISNADSFRETIEQVIEAKPDHLAFELGELTFMDSSGIAVMVHAANNVGSVELLHPTTIIRRVIEATGLTDVLRIDPS